MDERKPPIPPSEFHLRPPFEQACAAVDPAPVELAKSDQLVAVERQSRSGQVDSCRNDLPDGASVGVYYRSEDEVRDGFLMALRAMGVAGVEQTPEPAEPPTGGGKP